MVRIKEPKVPKTPKRAKTAKKRPMPSPTDSDMSSGLKPPSKLRPPARGDNGENSFVVGDRVLAAGKRGKVAFLGETEFASGQWAGIILDDPVGMFFEFF